MSVVPIGGIDKFSNLINWMLTVSIYLNYS
jgi:hypothetical protein